MIACVVLGDSIAAGVASFRPDCQAVAQSGINSTRYVQTLLTTHTAGTAVISLGANDDNTIDTVDNLRMVRREVHAQTVYWLLPGNKERARAAIRQVALQHGDRVIDTRPQAGPDHLHPTGQGYQHLAAATQGYGAALTLPAQGRMAIGHRYVHKPGTARAILELYNSYQGS